MDRDIAVEVETHESEVWSRLVEATGQVAGDPLGARVDRTHSVPLPALTAVDFGLFNRVIGLGVATETSATEVGEIVEWYAGQQQTSFWVEVAPLARPADLADLLERRGVVDTGRRQAKVWRDASPVPQESSVEVVELGTEHRDGFAEVNGEAWGASSSLAAWFGATLGLAGFRHFGVFADDRLVSTGAMFVSDGIAWLGYGATLPDYRDKGMQGATMARRINEAAAMGCRLVHTETAADTPERQNPSLHNMLRVGFTHLYDKAVFAPAVRE